MPSKSVDATASKFYTFPLIRVFSLPIQFLCFLLLMSDNGCSSDNENNNGS